MPQTVEPIRGVHEPAPGRVRWTRAHCDAMRDAGILTCRYELIDGEILIRSGQKPAAAVTVGLLMGRLMTLFGASHIRINGPLDLGPPLSDYNEPEPAATVTDPPVDAYVTRHPTPEEVLLVAEISDSTLRFDRSKKASLYALAGIQEYWVLDLNGRQLFVHRQPSPPGYLEITAYGADESVATLARPEALVRVGDLLP